MRTFSLLSSSFFTASVNAGGIEHVVTMLTDMKSRAESEKHTAEVDNEEYVQWCSDTKTQLTASIEKLTADIDENSAVLKASNAKALELGAKADKNSDEITALSTQKANDIEVRKEEAKVHSDTKKEYEMSIAAIKNAIEVLNAEPKTLGVKRPVKDEDAFLQIKSSSMTTAQKELVTMLVQAAPSKVTEKNPQATSYGYENQSGGIIQILTDLTTQFTKELREELKSETNRKGAHQNSVAAINGQVGTLEDENKRLAKQKADSETTAGAAKVQIEGDEATNKADKETLKKTKMSCSIKADEYAEAVVVRGEEIEALNNATGALTGVKNTEEITDAHAAKKEEVLGAAEAPAEEAAFFLQVRSSRSAKNAKRVLEFLKHEGERQNNKQLQLLSLKMSEGSTTSGSGFDDVIGMVRETIERLTKEILEETGKHGECKMLTEDNTALLDASNNEISETKANLDEFSGQMGTTEQQIKNIAEEEANSAAQIAQAEKLRSADATANAQTIKDAQEGSEAVDTALQILSDFYTKAKDVASFKGNQDQGSGVMDMLESIQMDFLKQKADTESAEAQQKSELQSLVDEADLAKATRDQRMTRATELNAQAKAGHAKKTDELARAEENNAALTEQKRVIEEDKGCSGLSTKSPDELYEERVAARKAEIESLKQALTMLSSV